MRMPLSNKLKNLKPLRKKSTNRMKKFYFLLLMYCAPLLFSNFGLVEYSVLHPKAKTVQSDSLQRTQRQVNLYSRPAEPTNEVNQEEENNSESIAANWGQYIVIGFKAILGFVINILAHI